MLRLQWKHIYYSQLNQQQNVERKWMIGAVVRVGRAKNELVLRIETFRNNKQATHGHFQNILIQQSEQNMKVMIKNEFLPCQVGKRAAD